MPIETKIATFGSIDAAAAEALNNLLSQLSSTCKRHGADFYNQVTQRSFMYLARDSETGAIVGTATLCVVSKPTRFVGLIEDVVVDSGRRRQGIAKQLMQALIEQAKRLYLDTIELTSNPTRVEARAMYEALGFALKDTSVFRLTLPVNLPSSKPAPVAGFAPKKPRK